MNQFIQLDSSNQLNNIDFSNGYACDMETGVCGPVDKKEEETKIEEKKNANNSLV